MILKYNTVSTNLQKMYVLVGTRQFMEIFYVYLKT